MNLIIRQLSLEDLPKVIEVIKKTIRISFAKIYPSELIENFCTKYTEENFAERLKTTTFFIAEDKNTRQILGVVGLQGNRLRTFYVDPDMQGKGIGSMLYNALENKARKDNIEKLILEGSPLGEPIYQHLGYKKLHSVEKERVGIKFKDAYMEKNLI